MHIYICICLFIFIYTYIDVCIFKVIYAYKYKNIYTEIAHLQHPLFVLSYLIEQLKDNKIAVNKAFVYTDV